MVEFAGYNMPVSYSGINEEHEIVRTGVGVFDVSHMGEFIIRGPHAKALIQKVTTNNVDSLYPGKAQYSCLPNENGGIIDDLLVYCIDENTYMLVVNASNIEKDWNWISGKNTEGAEMINISDDTTLLAIQGPKASEALQPLTDLNLSGMEYYTFSKGKFAGVDNVLVSATGYTGSGGFEIYFDKKNSKEIWDAIFEAGKPNNIKPVGLGARDTLRLEKGYCLYGNDIDDKTSPLEAGLGWITKLQSKDFIGKDKIVALKEKGVQRKLIGFELMERGIPRHGYNVLDANGINIGIVTSGTQSPSLKKAIGLGLIKKEFSAPDTEIFIEVRDKKLKAKVTPIPFI